jgi:putative endonuclease
MSAPQRIRAEQSGRWAETLAALALQLKGYVILGRRVQTGLGEIDLIARRGTVLAFIEVKMRQQTSDPALLLRPTQMARIIKSATGWAASRPWTQHFTWRYDLIVVRQWRWPVHLRDAWRPQFDPMLSSGTTDGNVIAFRRRRR